MFRRLAALLAAFAMVLAVAAPAFANDLHQSTPISADDPAFQGTDEDCANLDLQPGQVLWHFIHTETTSGDLASTLSATFDTGLETAPGFVNGDSIVMYDITNNATELDAASDTISNGGLLNLSHVCLGGPPPDVPEAPAAVLLLLSGLAGMAFVGWRMRRSAATI